MIINNFTVTTSVTTCHDLSRVSPYVLPGLNLVNLSYYHQHIVEVERITRIVSTVTGISIEAIRSKTRKRPVVLARRAAIALLWHLKVNYLLLASYFNIHYSAIFYHFKCHFDDMRFDKEYKNLFITCEKILNNHY